MFDAPRRGFPATWSLLMIISILCDPLVSIKTFSTHVVVKKCHVVSEPGLFTHEKIHRRGLAEEQRGMEIRGWEMGGGEWGSGRRA